MKILENWQHLKMHGMLLKRYLDEKSMELLKYKIKFFIGIQLKSLPWWLINKDWFREQQKTKKQGSAIVITVKGEAETKKLCKLGF